MNVKQSVFGTLPDGKIVNQFIISNDKMSFSVIEYGAIITSICVPDRKGKISDVSLGFDTLEDYVTRNDKYFGAIVGRFANRIKGASFILNNRTYQLDKNDNDNCLHGGKNGYDKMFWQGQIFKSAAGTGVKFFRKSENGEQGFPGNLSIEIEYILTENNEIVMNYNAKTDKDTPVNLTNHTYFNLAGNGNGSIRNHVLFLDSDKYLTVDKFLIPDGNIVSVTNNAFDFTSAKEIGKEIDSISGGGYDHCFVLSGNIEKCAARVYEPKSGRLMEMYTDQPGVQFYSGNFLGGIKGKNNKKYNIHDGFCLETQQFPDAPNKSAFPSCIITSQKPYSAKTIYKFSVKA